MRWLVCGLLAVCTSPATWGQAADAAMPSDPVELLTAAAKVNGLFGAEMKPWHLKATLESLDESGKVTQTGTFEEWWVSDKEWKQSYRDSGFLQTSWHTEKGTFRDGAQEPLPVMASRIVQEINLPFLGKEAVTQMNWIAEPNDSGGSKLLCVIGKGIKPNNAPLPFGGLSYCFDATRPLLRISARGSGMGSVLHNSIVQFQGQYVARDMQVVVDKKVTLRAHVDSIEELSPVVDADFVPPESAELVAKRISISAGIAQGNLLKQPRPIYPEIAKLQHIQGVVVIEGVIGRDGRVHSTRVISGPDELRQAALDAVKDAEYRPYRLNGQPVEVMTTINIVFRL